MIGWELGTGTAKISMIIPVKVKKLSIAVLRTIHYFDVAIV
jgi:hypothetical protein